MDKLARELPDHAALFKKMTGTCSELMKNLTDTYSVDGYKARPTYHVTTMFLGKEAWKVDSEIFKAYHEGQKVDIPIRALLFIPGKIMTGVCFPSTPIENKMPHMTLLLGAWQAKNSNDALEATCSKPSQPFFELYEKAKKQEMGGSLFASKTKIGKDTVDAFFVVLDRPIIFEAEHHEYV